MTKRSAAREETRRRIVEATFKLHGERGILGTSYRDIAEQADVSLATVYKHFPRVEDLLPACGALVMDRARPPQPEAASEIAGDSDDVEERLRRVADELFAYYERGGPHLEVDVRERELPGIREWQESERRMVAAFVRAALRPRRPKPADVARVSALFDLQSFKAFRERGVSVAKAVETVARAGACLIDDNKRRG